MSLSWLLTNAISLSSVIFYPNFAAAGVAQIASQEHIRLHSH
jgi:hypothetical protein